MTRMRITKLRYGNTNTFYISGGRGGLLVDTGYAGTLNEFYRAIKAAGIGIKDIDYVSATHYHPDHMGLIGELTAMGVRLLLADVQVDFVHFSDAIFARDRIPYLPADESRADVVSCAESRGFLSRLGINGEIIRTPSHSEDSVSLILDEGACFAGDLEPLEYLAGYEDNEQLRRDWERILSFGVRRVYFAHAPEKLIVSE